MSTPTSTDQHDVRVNDREQLIYLLTEAAEIEHGLMCAYLYALWSLRQSLDEAVTPAQLEAIGRWRKEIRSVAMEEMAHLATVNNLLMSIGSPPHFRRQNFPVPAGYHPASVVVRLAPLTRDTLAHFVYLERPEGMEMAQARGFESPADYRRRPYATRLTPTAEDFDTVGHLYRGIQQGFETLSGRLGETALFAGSPDAQLGRDIMDLPGLVAVTDLRSAIQAIEVIIEQGEGGRRDAEESHFARFVAMAAEYDAFLRDDPAFMPHRSIVSDPLMFAPIGDMPGTYIDAPATARVLDLANASYGLMLRLLASGSGIAQGSTAGRRAEIDSAVSLMHVVHALSVLLTTLPAGAAPTPCAGMNFHLPRSSLALPQREAGTALLAERANEIALALEALAASQPGLDPALAATLRTVAAALLEPAASR
ncbi:ferritin-like domain-containing protein [Massilia yuzhufengensis]|uniref:Ferritin-like n=1 Tax=Massilia yuzhufengensis TaxID=1164594 RepID=A0A1I1Q9Q5_9BURK|nr:ferritin-like protein [Massilia yuzhufengensis]SFD14850.1 Ferritin-like [Massilia yuzhufengensis]